MFSYLSNSYAIQPVVSTAQPHTSDRMQTLIMLRLCNFMCAFFDAVLRRRTSRRVSECPGWPRHRVASRAMQSRDFARVGVHSDAEKISVEVRRLLCIIAKSKL